MSVKEPVYVSGPMTGYPEFNYPAFTHACRVLRDQGLTVLSPHEVGETPGLTWADYIRKDLALLAQAQSVVVLDGWECSRGAQLEVYIAHALGMPVVPFGVLLLEAQRGGWVDRGGPND